jgi:hypothetical protein
MTQPDALRLADALIKYLGGNTATQAAAELRHLHGMVERLSATCETLKDALASSCDEERQQMWEAGPGGGCSRALTAEFQRDALLAVLNKLEYSSDGYIKRYPEEAEVSAAIEKAERT